MGVLVSLFDFEFDGCGSQRQVDNEKNKEPTQSEPKASALDVNRQEQITRGHFLERAYNIESIQSRPAREACAHAEFCSPPGSQSAALPCLVIA